ncbi:lipopolysaccharide biosynthesis protein [Candidatus Fermentibacterales bacterium]|nr:lipopolysaccharide biosynthesis protein [Candidatus Fermentibacterales bacterium]
MSRLSSLASKLPDGRLARRAVAVGAPALVSKVSVSLWGVVMIFVIRRLSEESYAGYAVTRSFLTLGAVFGGSFLMQGLMKFAAEGSGLREHRIVNAAAYLATASSVLIGALFFLLAGLGDRFYSDLDIESLLRLVGVLIFAKVMVAIPNSVLLARHRTARVMVSDLTNQLLSVVLIVFLLLGRRLHCAEQVLAAQLLSHAAALGVSYCLAHKEMKLALGTTLRNVRELMSFSVYSLGTSLAYRFYTQVDLMMLGKLASPPEVAAYGACRTLAGFLQTVNEAGHVVLLPLVSRMWTSGRRKEILRRLGQAIGILTLLLLPVVAVMSTRPVWVLNTIYGGKYNAGWPVLVALSLLVLIRPVLTMFSTACSGAGKPSICFQSVLVSSSVNVVLNLLLIPRLGGLGAAIATICAIIVGTAVTTRKFMSYWRSGVPEECGRPEP